jgi:ubiquinone biosynthesis protein UbiJ
MPIKVALQTIDNKKLEQIVPNALETTINDFLPFGDPAYPMLQYIDEYGDTIFNGLQMRGFFDEWDRLSHTLADLNQRKVALEIRGLAEKCQKNPHTFLRFIGD